MPTAERTAPLTVEEAEAGLRTAEIERHALLDRSRSGQKVEPIDLAQADAAVTLAETGVAAAHDTAAQVAESQRLALIADLRKQWVRAYEDRAHIGADFDQAVDILTRVLTAAQERESTLRSLTIALADAGPLPEGVHARRKGGMVTDPHGLNEATIDDRRWTDQVGRTSASLALDAAVSAIAAAKAHPNFGIGTITQKLHRLANPNGIRASDAYRAESIMPKGARTDSRKSQGARAS